MSETREGDEAFAEELLGSLRDDEPAPPPSLADRTIRRVQAMITARDLIDLTTVVFLLRFCAPLMDLVAAALGADAPNEGKRRNP